MIKARLTLAGLAVLAIAGSTATRHRCEHRGILAGHEPALRGDGNFGPAGQYLPGAVGFDLADVRSKSELDSLPRRRARVVWLGDCDGATAGLAAQPSTPSTSDPKLFGFYVIDDALPSACPAVNLLAEDNWFTTRVPERGHRRRWRADRRTHRRGPCRQRPCRATAGLNRRPDSSTWSTAAYLDALSYPSGHYSGHDARWLRRSPCCWLSQPQTAQDRVGASTAGGVRLRAGGAVCPSASVGLRWH